MFPSLVKAMFVNLIDASEDDKDTEKLIEETVGSVKADSFCVASE